MSATKGNGPDDANDRPAKKNTDNTTNFIAKTPTIGTFPKRRNTIIAEVLSRILNGEFLTGMEAVFIASTTRLSSPIHTLRKNGWPIKSDEKEVGTNDGRVTEISSYYLDPATIGLAFENGAHEFCQSVKEARAKLRKKAPEAKAKATKRNADRAAAKFNPNQGDLFSEDGYA
ncbi:hypothetical protein SAMN05216344_11494 [Polaromonas sp. OV174]|uniref:hypothetical protein n=1 Tax=Polaromonas sp. OV174 TaxID=1855300 RepID=UPI0008ED8C10|nr:hypothetical protein [Polaromonas sp. OV174]SFC33987.1 hypothetical protein SAMN05216344_11494 [Polaromonas sp. OV174]